LDFKPSLALLAWSNSWWASWDFMISWHRYSGNFSSTNTMASWNHDSTAKRRFSAKRPFRKISLRKNHRRWQFLWQSTADKNRGNQTTGALYIDLRNREDLKGKSMIPKSQNENRKSKGCQKHHMQIKVSRFRYDARQTWNAQSLAVMMLHHIFEKRKTIEPHSLSMLGMEIVHIV